MAGSFAAGASRMSGGLMGQGLLGIMGLSPDRKSGLSMMNPSLMKMNKGTGSKFGAKSQTSRSQATRRTGTMSRKSRQEEDFESMEIEEIDVLIENAEGEVKQLDDAKRKIKRQKSLTAKAREVKLEPIDEQLKFLRERITMLLYIKDAKIPFYDKLPKDN